MSNIDTYKAKQALRDAAMRRVLLEFLWGSTIPNNKEIPAMPMPMFDDEQVKQELERILGLKKEGWLW
jgi:hypothetical protein